MKICSVLMRIVDVAGPRIDTQINIEEYETSDNFICIYLHVSSTPFTESRLGSFEYKGKSQTFDRVSNTRTNQVL